MILVMRFFANTEYTHNLGVWVCDIRVCWFSHMPVEPNNNFFLRQKKMLKEISSTLYTEMAGKLAIGYIQNRFSGIFQNFLNFTALVRASYWIVVQIKNSIKISIGNARTNTYFPYKCVIRWCKKRTWTCVCEIVNTWHVHVLLQRNNIQRERDRGNIFSFDDFSLSSYEIRYVGVWV